MRRTSVFDWANWLLTASISTWSWKASSPMLAEGCCDKQVVKQLQVGSIERIALHLRSQDHTRTDSCLHLVLRKVQSWLSLSLNWSDQHIDLSSVGIYERCLVSQHLEMYHQISQSSQVSLKSKHPLLTEKTSCQTLREDWNGNQFCQHPDYAQIIQVECRY